MQGKLVSPTLARFAPLTSFHIIPKQTRVVEIGNGHTLRTTLGGDSLKQIVSYLQEREGIEVKSKKKGSKKENLAKKLLELI